MTEEIRNLVTELGDDTSQCYVCGHANDSGLKVRFVKDGEFGSRAHYTARLEHDGWPGVLHGGITFTLMDEALGWALFFQGLRGVTARVETKFKLPIRTGSPVVIRAWTTNRRRELVSARAEVRSDDNRSDLLAELSATMYMLAEDAPKADKCQQS